MEKPIDLEDSDSEGDNDYEGKEPKRSKTEGSKPKHLFLKPTPNTPTDAELDQITERYSSWKANVPYLYDSFENHSIPLRASTCDWGEIVHRTSPNDKQYFYYSCVDPSQSDSGFYICKVVLPNEKVSQLTTLNIFNEDESSEKFLEKKKVKHPGVITKLRHYSGGLLATLRDLSSTVYLWNTSKDTNPISLSGPTKETTLAMEWSTHSETLCVGSMDGNCYIWNINDINNLTLNNNGQMKCSYKTKGNRNKVNSVSFSGDTDQLFCCVADNKTITIYDQRVKEEPIQEEIVSKGPMVTVNWNKHDSNVIITGAKDRTIKILDIRKLQIPIWTRALPGSNISDIICSPHSPNYYAISGNSNIYVYDIQKGEMIFNHTGHRYTIEDFNWNSSGRGMQFASSSIDVEGGGTIQLWRPNDIISADQTVILSEIQNYLSSVISHVNE